jgi:hypothetical protein
MREIFGKRFYPVRVMQERVFCVTEQMFQIFVLLSENIHNSNHALSKYMHSQKNICHIFITESMNSYFVVLYSFNKVVCLR